MTPTVPEFSRIIPMGDVSRKNRTVELHAEKNECESLCRRFDLVALNSLIGTITYSLSRTTWIDGVETIDVSGTLIADVVQSCVVTSDDVATTIRTEFAGIMVPEEQPYTEADDEDDGSDGDDWEGPEILGDITGQGFDLGEVLAAQVSLELDPFPRKPDASFDGYTTEQDNDPEMQKPNPFAVLAKLKDNRE